MKGKVVKHKRFHLTQILPEKRYKTHIQGCVGHILSHALPDLTGKCKNAILEMLYDTRNI